MNTTHESTGRDDAERARREGSVLWARTKPLLDELQALRAEKAQRQAQHECQVQLMANRHHEQAEQQHQALIAAVEEICRAQDTDRPLSRMTSGDRVNVVLKRLKETPTTYGLPADWTSSDKKKRVVRKALKSWFESSS